MSKSPFAQSTDIDQAYWQLQRLRKLVAKAERSQNAQWIRGTGDIRRESAGQPANGKKPT
jgi:hypothetical protein